MFGDTISENERKAGFITTGIAQPGRRRPGPIIPPKLCETNITPQASIGQGAEQATTAPYLLLLRLISLCT